MSVLLTGAAGFIGSHLADRLLASGEEVVGLDLFDDFYAPRIKEENIGWARDHDRFREARGDIRDSAFLRALPDSIDAVVHLAARAGVRPSIEQPLLYTDVNVRGTAELLAFAKDRGIRSFVFASSLLCYAASHLDGLACICLRFFTVYGPRQRPDLAIRKFSRLLLSGEPLPRFGDGSTARDYTFIADIRQGVEAALAWTRGGDAMAPQAEPHRSPGR